MVDRGTPKTRSSYEAGFLLLLLCRLHLGGLLLDHLDEVVDDVGVLQAMVGQAVDVNLMGAVAAAGEDDVGLARLALDR